MAYNNGYPTYYPSTQNQGFNQGFQQGFNQGFQQNQAFQQQPQNYQQQNMPQNQLQIQNGGFMQIPTEEMARSYPVAPGNCVTFKIEGKPIVMEKSMGFSQLEAPRIDRYRLVREEDTPNTSNLPQEPSETSEKDINMFNDIKGQVEEIRADLDDIKKRLEKVEDLGA
jgi:flagellar biosynthesis/type III secretory pathway protein FliH